MTPSHRSFTRFCATAAAAAALILAPEGAAAQQIGRPIVTQPQHVHVTTLRAAAEITDAAATTELEATFVNPTGREQEAVWVLPLPAGATADGFTMTVAGKQMEGEVLDAHNARRVYEQIVRQRRDPGLLEQLGQGCLRARIYPIPAGAEAQVKVRLRSVLAPRSGMPSGRCRCALRSTGLAPQRVGVDVRLRASKRLGGIFTPGTGMYVVRKSEHEARASAELEGTQADADVVLQFAFSDREFGLTMLAHRGTGRDGHFMLWLAPRDVADGAAKVRKHVQFVLDTSGSMKGRKIEQAKEALRFFVRSLTPHDRFNVVPFSTEAEPFFDAPAEAGPEAIETAMRKIDAIEARGGTNIEDALRRALACTAPAPSSVPLHDVEVVVFLTDGAPTVGLTDTEALLSMVRQVNQRNQRVFVFGVGTQLNAKLLDRLADDNGGARDYVSEDESIELATSDLLTKLSHPVMSDLKLRIDGIDAYAVVPQRLPDLFKGSELVVVGRYRRAGAVTVRLAGRVLGVDKELIWEDELPEAEAGNGFVATLWAERRLRQLLDAIRLNGQKPELLEEVRHLAKEYGIVTPFTSHLILEEGMRLAGSDAIQATDGPRRRVSVGGGLSATHPTGPGSAGPSTPGAAGPATGSTPTPTAEGARENLARLGRADAGDRAVAESKATRTGSSDYFLGGKRREGRAAPASPVTRITQRVADRTFYAGMDVWIDSTCPKDWAAAAEKVEAFSEAYFALLAAHPELKDAFALGPHVVVKIGDRIVEVTAPKAADKGPDKQG